MPNQFDILEEAYECKKLRYTELVANAQHHGWIAKVQLVEVGCRGFVATSNLHATSGNGGAKEGPLANIQRPREPLEQGSQWLWMKKSDSRHSSE